MGKWFDIWFDDMVSIIETMQRNLQADLEAGYHPYGSCIQKQQTAIEEKQKYFDAQMESFKMMDPGRVNHWCYYDLKKRGAIS